MQSQENLPPCPGLSTPAQHELLSPAQPSITWLNMTGDVTITWSENDVDLMRELVESKMAQGYAFFIIKPRALKFLGTKKEPLTKLEQLNGATGLVVPDSQVRALLAELRPQNSAKVDDSDIETVLQRGHLRLVKPVDASKKEAVKRASSAAEVLRAQTVAIRPVVGG